ncbi:alpha/beta hydrolase [Leptospira perolatii]|uniref:Alpha/beta hydrolase n=1 Tax=Leptospira perolatii TaxID=2023191 RepID=A0A2M9ZSS3_9LEPT|nr:alpha/beta hydrolase [Leptospira perolatii]PJZ68775.1 alpha/beta hydrolase [Leptospira perolatii]PJZ75130.1 alpha/beta hydrolase [Leptospira perolatii]
MRKDYLTYLPENKPIRPFLVQRIAEFYYRLFYLACNLLGIFIKVPDHIEGFKRPIVLVTGFLGRPLTWNNMRKHLIELGHPVYTVDLGFQVGNIRKKSKQLEQFLIERKIKDCYLVCHSMGGLIAAGLTYKGRDRVRKVYLVGSPIHGTRLAYIGPMFIACWQMMPGSKIVKEVIETYSKYHNVQAVFTKGEEIVLPWQSSRLGNHDDVEVPEYGHINLVLGPLGIECIGSLVTSEEKKDPLPIKVKPEVKEAVVSEKSAKVIAKAKQPVKAMAKQKASAAPKKSSSKSQKQGSPKKQSASKANPKRAKKKSR